MTEVNKKIEKETKEADKPVKETRSITLKINSQVMMIIVLVVLMVVSVAQAIELGSLKEKISTGEVKAATSGSSSGGSSSTPANLKDLPSMVGGC